MHLTGKQMTALGIIILLCVLFGWDFFYGVLIGMGLYGLYRVYRYGQGKW